MKKYLKTPEAVISALKEGKTVYSACGKYRMIDDILVFKCGNLHTINASVSLDEKPYIEGREPFKIEVGEFYKTKGGEKARCYILGDDRAFFTVDDKGTFSTYHDGRVYGNPIAYQDDIIGPWEEE